jgi:two-component system, OmpR family, KDP operon response regulator KdpE
MTTESPLVLVVDDESAIRKLLVAIYGIARFRVVEAVTAAEALEMAAMRQPDLIVLDLGLPDGDGADVLQRLREWTKAPVIVLSVRSDEQEKVRLLELGADDYVTKPFGSAELVARSRTALRRSATLESAPTIHVGELVIDLAFRQVHLGGKPVALPRKEYQLLALLAAHHGKVLTHRQLLTELWGPAHVDDLHYLRILVRKLRNHIEMSPAHPVFVVTELGVGYRLSSDEGRAGA